MPYQLTLSSTTLSLNSGWKKGRRPRIFPHTGLEDTIAVSEWEDGERASHRRGCRGTW